MFLIFHNLSVSLVFSSVQSFSCLWFFATPWAAACQASLSITSLGVCSNSCPLSQWCHPTISSSVIPFSSCLQSFPATGHFQWVSSSHQVAKVLEFQFQHQSFQQIFRVDFLYWLVWSPCSPRDSQESSPTPQVKSINFLCAQLFLWSNSHIHTWPLEKLWLYGPLSAK